ncbi:unnamed protein product [Symbiodinium sp. CCMP2592]|nr:unnamed protein product [Symbiodinium sp. CCMP2592]
MLRAIFSTGLAIAAATGPAEVQSGTKLSQKFDYGVFDQITAQLDPEKLEENMLQAMTTNSSARENTIKKMMGKLQAFAKDEQTWEQQAIDAFHGKLSESCDKLVEAAGEATVKLQKDVQEQRIAPFEEDEGCVGQLSEAIKKEMQKKLGDEHGFHGLGAAVAYVSMMGANYGCESEAGIRGLDLEDEAARLCGKAVFERQEKEAEKAAKAAAKEAAKMAAKKKAEKEKAEVESASTDDASKAFELKSLRRANMQRGVSTPVLFAALLAASLAAVSAVLAVVSMRRTRELLLIRATEDEYPVSD